MPSLTEFANGLVAYFSGVQPTAFVVAEPAQGLGTWTRYNAFFRDGLAQGTGGWMRDKCWAVGGPNPEDSRADTDFTAAAGRPPAQPDGIPNTGVFSISMWVYNIQSSVTVGQGGSAAVGASHLRVPIRRSNNVLPAENNLLGFRQPGGSGGFVSCGYQMDPILEDNLWHHLVVVSDGNTPNNAKYYVDGQFVGQLDHPGGPIVSNWEFLCNDSSGDDQFGEKYADIAIWERLLTEEEIEQIHTYGIVGRNLKDLLPQMQLVDNATEGYNASWVYMLDNELLFHLYDDVADDSGNGQDGTLVNHPAMSSFVPGLTLYSGSGPGTTTAPYATEFTDCYEQDPGAFSINVPNITCTAASNLDIDADKSRTLMIWAKCPSWDIDRYIWSMGATTTRARFNLKMHATDPNTIELRFGSPGPQHVSYDFGFDNTEWTHYAVTTNVADQLKLYVNGELVDTNNMTNPLATADTHIVKLGIGFTSSGLAAVAEYWIGQLQEFAVFSREMSAAEIKNIYDTQKEKTALPPLVNLGPAGNSVNDNLIWSWGWEFNASLFPYANEAIEPLVPYLPTNADWVPINYHPPNDYPRGLPFPVGGGPIFGDPGGASGGDPYWPGGSPPNRRYPWGADWCIQPNFNASEAQSRFFRYGWQDITPGTPPEMIAGVSIGDLGSSQNPIPGKSYGAGSRCLVMTATNKTTAISPELQPITTITFNTPPLLFTPHVGKYNRAISASADPDVPGATETRGPRQGWLQTSWKQICNVYQWTMAGPPPTVFIEPDRSPGGSQFIPIITMWRGYLGQGSDEEMLIGLYPVDQDPDPLTKIKAGGGFPSTATRDVMLAIAPAWQNGVGPSSFPGTPASPGPIFTIDNDAGTPLWKRLAIQFEFVGDPNNALACAGYISASIYLDGVHKGGTRVDKVPGVDTYKDWNRVGFGAGVYPALFDHSYHILATGGPGSGVPGLQAGVTPYGDYYFTCFGMHDHVFLWGATGSEGTSSYYIQGLNPKTDVQTGGWLPLGANITLGENWSTVDDRMNPDMWFKYPVASTGIPSETIPTNFLTFRNDISQSNYPIGIPPINTYKFSLQKTSDIDPEWRPANIRSVQQISNHGYKEEGATHELKYIYTTMSIGTTLVDSWPGPHLPFPAPAPDENACFEEPHSNMIYILSSASYTGNLWTFEELNKGTGSLYATDLT